MGSPSSAVATTSVGAVAQCAVVLAAPPARPARVRTVPEDRLSMASRRRPADGPKAVWSDCPSATEATDDRLPRARPGATSASRRGDRATPASRRCGRATARGGAPGRRRTTRPSSGTSTASRPSWTPSRSTASRARKARARSMSTCPSARVGTRRRHTTTPVPRGSRARMFSQVSDQHAHSPHKT